MSATILLYGRTGAGKTTQIGHLAEDVYTRTGKKTRLYTADRGGIDTIGAYADLGIIEVVELGTTDIWVWTNRAVNGYVRDASGKKWVLDPKRNAEIGFWAFESFHGITKLMKLDMEKKAALGINTGGDTNTSFEAADPETNERIKIGSTKGYQKFAIPQARIWEEMLQSQRLPGEYLLWTAGASKDEDDVNVQKVVGPDIIGRAMTGTIPMDFNYTMRIDMVPAQAGKPERHILYLGNHIDQTAGNAMALGNIRRPLDAKELTQLTVEPANLVKALQLIRDEGRKDAREAIKRRIEASQHRVTQLAK